MLACARIGAPHTVVFGGFSAEALARPHQGRQGEGRDHRRRRLAARPDRAAQGQRRPGASRARSSRRCVVVKRCANDGRVARRATCGGTSRRRGAGRTARAEPFDSEHTLFSLYTSGTTGKPKGILHTTGGYLTGATYTTKMVFDLRDDDIFWCTADIGWVTGHSYVVYGPLANGATVLMYEGAPNHPDPDRFWEIIAKWGVTVFYTAPTAIRAFMRWGDAVAGEARSVVAAAARLGRRADQPRGVDVVPQHDRRRPLPDRRHVVADRDRRDHDLAAARARRRPSRAPRRARCPASRPTSCDKDGTPCKPNEGGFLVDQAAVAVDAAHDLRRPRALREDVLRRGPRLLLRGRRRAKDDDGYFWVWAASTTSSTSPGTGCRRWRSRARSSSHPKVAEAAVVGRPDELKGQAIVAFVTPRQGVGRRRRAREGAARARGARRSARSRGPRRSGSPRRCRRRARARSCGGCCARSRGQRRAATRRRSRSRDRPSRIKEQADQQLGRSAEEGRKGPSPGAKPQPARPTALSASGLVGSPSLDHGRVQYGRGATSFGPSGWNSAARELDLVAPDRELPLASTVRARCPRPRRSRRSSNRQLEGAEARRLAVQDARRERQRADIVDRVDRRVEAQPGPVRSQDLLDRGSPTARPRRSSRETRRRSAGTAPDRPVDRRRYRRSAP